MLDQVYPQIELVICDDGSTHQHQAIAGILCKFPGEQVIFRKKSTISLATNTAIQDAMGEYLLSLIMMIWFHRLLLIM